jgi:hypothetical protein
MDGAREFDEFIPETTKNMQLSNVHETMHSAQELNCHEVFR